jgi:hypothetical protein
MSLVNSFINQKKSQNNLSHFEIYDLKVDVENLVRYIDWVVSKPSGVYDERLLRSNEIGSWITKDGTLSDQPASPTTPPPNEPPLTEPTYPPVGRAGFYVDEEASVDGDLYKWTNLTGGRWLFQENLPSNGGGDTGGDGGYS